jgi:hypothetical protein
MEVDARWRNGKDRVVPSVGYQDSECEDSKITLSTWKMSSA